jgi:hypothetical protein
VLQKARVETIYSTLAPSIALRDLRNELLRKLSAGEDLREVAAKAQEHVKDLETALLASKVLDVFEYSPYKREENPAFTPEEEEYARGGLFSKI